MSLSDWIVIVVEDTFDDQQIVSRLLKHYGANVHIAQDGQDCLTLLNTVDATLIITDLTMPNMDGWQTLDAIRNNPATHDIPVVAMTAYHETPMADDARQAGFDAYFPKPLDVYTFIPNLETILNEKSS